MLLDNLTARGKIILSLILVCIVVAVAGYYAWQKHAGTVERLQQAAVLTEQQAKDKNVLQNKLNMSNQNAEMLSSYIAKAQVGQVQPVNYFTVQATDLPAAAQQVANRINDKDPTLPPQALEKTDRTVVVANTNKTPASNYDVGVFKVNNYRAWAWSVGVGVHGGDRYIPVELQRNFSKDAAVSAEYHYGGREKGFEFKYTRKTDKLFGLF